MEPLPSAAGFVSVIVDVPFLLAVPNDTYRVRHPDKGLALVQTIKREGSRAFFRNMPITSPTPFADLERQAQAFFR